MAARLWELLKAFLAFLTAGWEERRRRDEIARRARVEAETEITELDADERRDRLKQWQPD